MRLATCDPQFQALKPIRYTLRFPAPHTHYVEVEASIPTAGRTDVEVYMAMWTPGSYLIREYERNVEAVTAANGTTALAVEKSRKNRWKITTGGAPTFITVTDRAARAHEVKVELPAAWKGVQTPLMPVAGAVNTFRAEDFDTPIDSPIILGNPVVREFTVDGKKHALVLEGDTSLFDADRAAADSKKIVEAGRNVMGPLLYPHYTPDRFYQVMSEAAGSDLKGWFAKAAESTDELDYTEALDFYGLRFRPTDTRNARAFIGGGTRNDAGHRGRPQRGR